MSRKSTGQAAIEELRAIKDRCAVYAEDSRIREAKIAALEAELARLRAELAAREAELAEARRQLAERTAIELRVVSGLS